MARLSILHFNDVYRVSPQKIGPPQETIDVTQFDALVHDLKNQWPERGDGKRDGLVLFSGDLFSPSVESSVTRGSHMVPVMNEIGVDVALTGNHDFDFGYPHLTKLVRDSVYPWILSNIIDETTAEVPASLHPFQVVERSGVRIGIIGLVEEEWITTVSSWPPEFGYKDMTETGLELSRKLRDPKGEYRCDIIIALSHSRLPNDIRLAKQLLALSPSSQNSRSLANEHGVDILLGGHDHLYFISKGINEWEGHDKDQDVLGAEEDKGDVLVVKSGCDFRDLSEIWLELEDTPEGSIRRKVIKKVHGKHHITKPEMRSSAKLTEILKTILSSVSSAMKAPVCRTTAALDLRSAIIRVQETPAANWFADVLRHAYDEALCMRGDGGSDAVFICAGTLRGDTTYGPGIVTLGDILEILPFDDPVVVLELDGEAIWDALESALSLWPAQEGRFPVLSGLKVTWDSRLPPGKRVLSVSLWKGPDNDSGYSTPKTGNNSTPDLTPKEEAIARQKGGRRYKVVTRDYMAEGHDGYSALKGKKYLIDHESGSIMSSIVRKYLLGSQFVNKMSRMAEGERPSNLADSTNAAISRAVKEKSRASTHERAANRWKHAIDYIVHRARSHKHYSGHMKVSMTEHMSSVDPFDGSAARQGQRSGFADDQAYDGDLLVISPEMDGRLKNVAEQ